MSALRGDAGQQSDHTVDACASPPDVGATTRRRLIAGGLSFGAAAALASFAPANALAQGRQPGADELTPPAPRSIEVRARPIEHFDLRDRARRQFGVLQFRSGLILTSSFRGFGGLSGLRLDPRGERFVAISDKATWFTGRIVYAGSVMTGLADVEAAPLLAADGAPFRARKWYDSESLAFDGGTAYVGFERVNQIVKFEFGHGGVRSRGQPIAIPPALRKLPNNKGIEALVMVPRPHPLSGTLIAVSERGLDAARNTIGFLIGGRTPGQFAIHRTANYDIADAALLPDGDLLILERKFSWIEGVHIRIRRIALRAIVPGATVDGPAIFEADLGHEIDNMEALDVHLDEEGAIVLTMLSDDNFSMLQRTLLLQFSLIPD
ncbi:twin-arginine translocation pathway signal [Rhodopseudomonas sp. WA056]|uniref:esterase-like activity of phytase family protein n=1 Tax=Rhodopseudomonas sp. WA056 TaxID=2269367 RepID=UPI0013DEBFF0|nr:esterase-like activity of phytase family protein [Rhodopseudomonas sp. WA056]NEW88645.1 twin-arginine translocation pathway signal [Rhodopseudomonas sp. WA056]